MGVRSTLRCSAVLPKFVLGSVVALVGIMVVMAADPDPLQDFCVGDLSSNITLNGLVCKNPKLVKNEDFAFTGIATAGNTSEGPYGFNIKMAFAAQFPGINTQGLAMARIDFAPNGGLNVPHWHPRASEMLFVVNGTLMVGFVDQNNRLWSNTLQPGGVTVFPRGLVHYQVNVAKTPALAIAVLGSQNPGRINSGNSLFASDIPDFVLEKTFNLSREAVQQLKAFFRSQNLGKINQDPTSGDEWNLNSVLKLFTDAA